MVGSVVMIDDIVVGGGVVVNDRAVLIAGIVLFMSSTGGFQVVCIPVWQAHATAKRLG